MCLADSHLRRALSNVHAGSSLLHIQPPKIRYSLGFQDGDGDGKSRVPTRVHTHEYDLREASLWVARIANLGKLIEIGVPSSLHSTAEGLGLVEAMGGMETSFFIHTKDSEGSVLVEGGWGEELSVTLGGRQLKMEDLTDGSYRVKYTAEEEGTPRVVPIHVMLAGVHIQGSPVEVRIVPKVLKISIHLFY